MSITKINKTVQVDDVEVRRRVEERTNRVEIITPFNDKGPSGYHAVAYREWVEYENDVPIKITTLPPLHIAITPSQYALLSGIAYRIDMLASKAAEAKKWPVLNGYNRHRKSLLARSVLHLVGIKTQHNSTCGERNP